MLFRSSTVLVRSSHSSSRLNWTDYASREKLARGKGIGSSQIVELAANFKMAATAQRVKLFFSKNSFQRLNDEEARRS